MNITDLIEIGRSKLAMEYPSSPKSGKVFIGQIQKKEMEKIAWESGHYGHAEIAVGFLNEQGERRIEFKGLKVYVVDDESYCLVAP